MLCAGPLYFHAGKHVLSTFCVGETISNAHGVDSHDSTSTIRHTTKIGSVIKFGSNYKHVPLHGWTTMKQHPPLGTRSTLLSQNMIEVQ